MRLLVVTILLLAALPPPASAAATWSVEAHVTVTSSTLADFTWRIDGLTNTRLRLPMPDNATFVEAKEDGGAMLTASTSGGDVEVTSRSRPFTIHFRLEGVLDTPFVTFPAQVASATDSPVSVDITLPVGWTLSGSRGNGAALEGASRYTQTGPTYVQYLVLPAPHQDPGVDRSISGSSVRREAAAEVRESGTLWTLVTTYDTDVYSRDWTVHVPEGARVVGASTPFGPLATTPAPEGVVVRAPYPVGYGLGGRSFTVNMELPAPDAHGGTFRLANLTVRAAQGDEVALTAKLPPSAEYAGARVGGGAEVSPLRFEGTGPLSVGVAYLPPVAPDHARFREGIFIVDVPRPLEAAARATARNASEILPAVASFVYDDTDDRPFLVAYTDAEVFSWEEGYYSNGLNTITIRATKTLGPVTDGRAHLVPVGVLIHEATHGLVDRRLPTIPHNVSFLHEGLSRLAETRTEGYFPSEVISCQDVGPSRQCDRHSARPAATDLQSTYRSGTSFDAAWGTSTASDADRGALYDHSGLVLHAFTQRAPLSALPNALAHMRAATFTGPDREDARRIVDILLANTPGTTERALLVPGMDAASLPIEEFRFCMGTLTAPAYPWETNREPSGGCPASGYGPRDAELPPAPSPIAPEPATPRPTPPPLEPPPPVSSTPPSTTPTTQPPTTEPTPTSATTFPTSPSTTTPAPGSATPTAIPAPAPGLLLAVFMIAALALRRSQRRG